MQKLLLSPLLLLFGQPALAADKVTDVEGTVNVPPNIEEPPFAYTGFIETPIPNPIRALSPYDPRPEMFVFLEGGPEGEDAKAPTNVTWVVQNHSFAPLVLPVVSGSTVTLTNSGRTTHVLSSPDQPGIFSKEPIVPSGTYPAAIQGGATAIHLFVPAQPHIAGRIVPLPTRYFATVNRDGSFKIPAIPPGDWTARVWYREGFLDKTYPFTAKGKSVKVAIDLPEQLPKPPAAKAAPPAAAPTPAEKK